VAWDARRAAGLALHGGHGGPVAGLGRVEDRPGDGPLFGERLFARVVQTRVCKLGLRLLQTVSGDGDVLGCPVPGGRGVAVLQPGDDLALLHPATLLDAQVHQPSGQLGGHGGFAVGHDIAARVQLGQRLGRVEALDGGRLDLHRGREEPLLVESGYHREQEEQQNTPRQPLLSGLRAQGRFFDAQFF